MKNYIYVYMLWRVYKSIVTINHIVCTIFCKSNISHGVFPSFPISHAYTSPHFCKYYTLGDGEKLLQYPVTLAEFSIFFPFTPQNMQRGEKVQKLPFLLRAKIFMQNDMQSSMEFRSVLLKKLRERESERDWVGGGLNVNEEREWVFERGVIGAGERI